MDYTIAATGGDISGATLATNLAGGNIIIQSTNGGAGTAGDVNVNDVVAWSANTLTLNAQNNININANLNGSGTAGLALEYGQGALAAGNLSDYIVHAAVNLPAGPNFSTKLGSDGAVANYTVITSLGVAGSTTGTDLQGMNGNLAGKYALGSDIDASGTSGWNASAGWLAVGNNTTKFTGRFAGLGHAISGLTINRSTTNFQGLFGYTNGATLRDAGLLNVAIVGMAQVGGLAGNNSGTISNSYATGSVSGTSTYVGGLAGNNNGTISSSYATGSVSGVTSYSVGGLVGGNIGTIISSYATGSVSGASQVGGLMGENFGTISNSYATGSVTGTDYVGGLVGVRWGGTISNSHYSIDNVTITINGVVQNNSFVGFGGLYAAQYADWIADKALVTSDYFSSSSGRYQINTLADLKNLLGFFDTNLSFDLNADLALTAGFYVPYFKGNFYGNNHLLSGLNINQPKLDQQGMFGYLESGSTISDLSVSGSVTGRDSVGGLVGYSSGTVSNSYATATVQGNNVGGLVGYNSGTVSNSYATGSVIGTDYVGGLVGTNSGAVSNSYSTATVNGSSSYVGGLVGNNNGTIANSYATGSVTGAASWIGGLVGGSSTASIGTTNSYWNTQTTGQAASTEGTPLTTAGMKQLASFSGWDISASGGSNAVWRIYEGQTAPLLRGFLTPSTVTANAASKTYDGLAYSGGNGITCSTGSCAAANYLGAAAYSGTSQGATNASTYVLTPSGFYSNQQGYDISYANGTLTVDPRAITATANAASKTYDGNAYTGGNGVAYSGFVNGETSTVLGGTLAYGGSSQGAINAGSYAVAPSGLTSGNYTISYANGTLTVTPAPLTATANAASKTYDGNAYSGGNGVAYSGFVNGETSTVLGGTLAYGGNSQGATHAGSYTLTPSGLTSANYTLSFANGALTISKVPLTVAANNASKTYDGNAYSGGNGVAYSGFVNGETSAVLGGTLAYGGTSQGAINTGSYTLTLSGLAAGNYTISYANGVLTITAAPEPATANGVTGGDIARALTERPVAAPPQAAPALMAAASPAAVNVVMNAIPGLMEIRADFVRLPGE